MEREYTEEHYNAIVGEIGRLSSIIYLQADISVEQAKGLAYVLNLLAGILSDKITINDFHDGIAHAPEVTREFYYKLLF